MRNSFFIGTFLSAAVASANPLCSSSPIDAVRKSTTDVVAALTPSKAERIQTFCKLKERFRQAYGAYEIKESRSGVKIDQHFDRCIRAEFQIENSKWEYLEFQDRLRKCIAGLNDSHLEPHAQAATSTVRIGLRLKKIGSRFFVAAVNPTYLSLARSQDLSIGAEILRIDGQSADAYFENIKSHISGSSPKAVDHITEEKVFLRDFAYPKSAHIKLEIRTNKSDPQKKVLSLPWVRQSTRNHVSEKYLDELGIPVFTDASKQLVGFDANKPLFKDKASRMKEFFHDRQEIGLRLATVQGEQNFCYMQLLTFWSRKWTQVNGPTDALDYLVPIQHFIRYCERREMPLVLDLRKNNGGYTTLPSQVMSLFARPGETYGGHFFSARNTPHTLTILQKVDPQSEDAAKWEAAQHAVKTDAAHLPLVASQNIQAAQQGFTQKIVALVSPLCMSSCDLMAGLLKYSGRATLVGSHTSGTGAGYWTEGRFPSTYWADDYGQVQLRIPNLLFGVLPSPTEKPLLPFADFNSYITENRPFFADPNHRYETTLEDLVSSGAGWEAAAQRALGTHNLP